MSYLTLPEAAAYINRRSSHKIEPAALLRAGVHGALLISAPFSGFMRNMTYSRNEDVLGLLIIPPRHLLEIELEGETRILGALSLDGGAMYSPQVKRTSQQLVILVSELDRFIPMLCSPLSDDTAQPSVEELPRMQNAWDTEVLSKLQYDANQPGITHRKLAEKHGVSRQMIGKMLVRAKEQLGPVKATAFDGLKVRNRK
ncbi:hypothetical protein [Pseudoduganella violacea]|uniref:Uncharacterized protein n=1 Tax=Pseudoduganella violacea TaxID=1715466 RepID=A0A7W5B880_9BURK|nr:hypothetical protein [Pseudoduganella violacea]MBB3118362.1 hypothetical protein [Pseudoduganella violacea]